MFTDITAEYTSEGYLILDIDGVSEELMDWLMETPPDAWMSIEFGRQIIVYFDKKSFLIFKLAWWNEKCGFFFFDPPLSLHEYIREMSHLPNVKRRKII